MALPHLQLAMSQMIQLWTSADNSPFIKDVVNGKDIIDEDERTITAQTQPASKTDPEFSDSKPEDLKKGAISYPF